MRYQSHPGAPILSVNRGSFVPNVPQLGGAAHQRLEQDRWRCRATVDEDLLAGPDACDGLTGGDDVHATSIGDRARIAACHQSRRIGP
jgi:hypothetical protein